MYYYHFVAVNIVHKFNQRLSLDYASSQNFLDNFPPHDVVLAVVRGFLFFQILTVYPLLGFFIRNQLFTYLLGAGYEYKLWQVSLLNMSLITFSVLVAILYPNIGFIIR